MMMRKHERTMTYQKTGGTPGDDGMAQAKHILCSCNWSTGYMRAEDAELLIDLHIAHPDETNATLFREYYLIGVAANLDAARARLRAADKTVLVESTLELLDKADEWLRKEIPK